MISRVDGLRKPWRVRTRDSSGRQVQRSFPTKHLAIEFQAQMDTARLRVQSGLETMREHVTYQHLASTYLASYDRRSKFWLAQMLSHSVAEFGHVRVRELKSDKIAAWLASLPLAPKTREHVLKAMRQVLETGVEWNYLLKNPARPSAVKTPSQVAPNIRPLQSWGEVEAVALQAASPDASIIRFACATGLRPQEWLALEWRDIEQYDTSEAIARIRRTYRRGELRDYGKSDRSLRTVILSKNAISALPEPNDGLIFRNANGGHINLDNWRSRCWVKAVKKAKLEPRPLYQMRHTFATLALAKGVSIDWISRQMGHSDIRITLKFYARYLKDTDERMRRLLNGDDE